MTNMRKNKYVQHKNKHCMQYEKASCCFRQQTFHFHPPSLSKSLPPYSLNSLHWRLLPPCLPSPLPHNPLIHIYTHTHTHYIKHDYITKPVSLGVRGWSTVKLFNPVLSTSSFTRRWVLGPWCSRSTRRCQGCTLPWCWGSCFHRIRPQRRWPHPAWPPPRCCVRKSCCPTSSTHCGLDRTPPHSGVHESRQSRQWQTVCLKKVRTITHLSTIKHKKPFSTRCSGR